jgi:hypothetical protein
MNMKIENFHELAACRLPLAGVKPLASRLVQLEGGLV